MIVLKRTLAKLPKSPLCKLFARNIKSQKKTLQYTNFDDVVDENLPKLKNYLFSEEEMLANK